MVLDETHFVMKNGEVKQPKIATDGLQLYYDMKGKKDTDIYNDRLLDMSGNNKYGTLSNFAYDKGSGFSDGLVFDGVDDKLTMPELEDIEVVSATKNMFDANKIQGKFGSSSPLALSAVSFSLIENGFEFTINANFQGVMFRVSLKKGTQYTLSNSSNSSPARILIKPITLGNIYEYNETIFSFSTSTSRNSFTTPITHTDYWLIYDNNTDALSTATIYDIQIEEGSVATPYVPYIPVPKMTYQLNGNILSYDEGGVVRRVQDGQVVERKGINLIRNGNFWNGTEAWAIANSKISSSNGKITVKGESGTYYMGVRQHLIQNWAQGSKVYVHAEVRLKSDEIGLKSYIQMGGVGGGKNVVVGNINDMKKDNIYTLQGIVQQTDQSGKIHFRVYINENTDALISAEMEVFNCQLIDLTAHYGAGNEPTLEEIQSEPEKWAWTPNPMDLLEAKELKGNILGDVEGIIDDLNKEEVSGESPIFTTKADDAVVRVEVDGKSQQANPPYREVVGESIVIENNEENKLRKLALDGKSFQNAGSEKNVISSSKPVVGIRYTTVEDIQPNYITAHKYDVSGELSYTTTNSYTGVGLIATIKPNTMYTYKYVIVKNAGKQSRYYYDKDMNFLKGIGAWTTLQSDISPENAKYVVFTVIPLEAGEVVAKDIQIEEGLTATAYEPPAPSPDYPIAINSLNNVDVVSSVGKENLAKLSSYAFPDAGSATHLYKHVYMGLKNNTDYSFQSDVTVLKGNPTHVTIYPYRASGQAMELSHLPIVNGKVKGSFSTDNRHIYDLLVYNGQAGETQGNQITLDNIKIEEGELSSYSDPLDVVEYDTPNPTIYKTNILLSEPLRSVGDVKDRLFLGTDGLWKVERNVIEVLLKPSNMLKYPSHPVSGLIKWYTMEVARKYSIDSPIMSNRFKSLPMNKGYEGSEVGISTYVGRTAIYGSLPISLVTTDDTAGLIKYFTENPTTVLLAQETPTIETLPAEQQTKLNQLYNLYSPATYFYTLSDIKGTLTAGYKLLPTAEPMAEDILAPTPEYPEEIKSFDKSFDVVSSVGTRNLFTKKRVVRKLTGAIEATRTSEGFVLESTENTTFRINNALDNNGTYTFSAWVTSEKSLQFSIDFADDSTQRVSVVPNKRTFVTATGSTSRYSKDIYNFIDITILSLTGDVIVFEEVKIERGSTQTPYTLALEDIPYNTLTNQTYKTSISLAEPLRSVGNVSDRLFKDSDGLWKVGRNIGEYIIKEGMSWNRGISGSGWKDNGETTAFYNYNIPNKPQNKASISTHFRTYVGSSLVMVDTEGFSTGHLNYSIIRIAKNKLESDDKAGLDKWLVKNPVTVQYELATPTLETLPEETQQQLNNLPSFDGTTYVYTVSESGMNPHMKAEFLPEDFKQENLTVNSLKIYNRPLEDAELLKNYTIEKERFPMGSPREVNPTAETLTITQGNFVGNTLSLDYTLEI